LLFHDNYDLFTHFSASVDRIISQINCTGTRTISSSKAGTVKIWLRAR